MVEIAISDATQPYPVARVPNGLIKPCHRKSRSLSAALRSAALLPAAILLWTLAADVAAQTLPARAGAECRPDPDGPLLKRAAFPPAAESKYILPFEPGRARLVWRTTSHFNPGNKGVGLYAIDIEMPVGTPLIAARAGRVVAVQQSFPDGNDTDLEENFVMIEHDDKTVARYIHLKQHGARIEVGNLVNQGQRIGLSGNSGQTGGPHLHFDVQTCGPNLPPSYNTLPCGQTVPVNFRNAGPNECGLVPDRRYRALP